MARTSSKKLELLRKLMQEKGMGDRPSAGIPRRGGSGDAPLSFGQQRLWFLDQLEPGTSLYNDMLVLRLSGGPLDEDLFERCLEEVVRRHDVLRTSFHEVDGTPGQRVHPGMPLPLERVDLRHLPEEERRAESERILVERVREPYRLEEAPLARAVLIGLGEDAWAFGLTMHHIVSDGVSYGIVYREMSALYEAFSKGEGSPLPELDVRYADYAAWERDTVTEELIEEKLAFWREYLADSPELVNLPTKKARAGHATHRGAFHRFRLADSLYGALQGFCRREQVTSNWVLLAAYFATLHLFTGQIDLRVGVSSSSRTRRELEPLVGFFVQTLLVRGHLDDDPSFLDLIRRTRERALEASEHQDVPFDRVIRDLRRADRPGDVPPIQIWFGHMKDVVAPMRVEGMSTSYEIVDPRNARFDLALILDETGGELSCYFEYDVDLLETSTVERIADRYLQVLRLVLDHPQTRLELVRESFPETVATPGAVSDAERRILLEDFARVPSSGEEPTLVTERIAEQATRAPEAVAVAGDGRTLTYRELDRWANRLARHLRESGVGANDFVGIYMNRSPEMIVSILGVLKARAAYLPLPPSYPAERVAFMLEDTGAPVVLTRAAEREGLPERGARILDVDEAAAEIEARDDGPLARNADGEDLAYVIYTSGSTGKPKGVPITHGNLAHSTRARYEYYELAVTGYLLLSSFAFDSSVPGIFWTLCQGGRLVLPPEGFEQDVTELGRLIAEHRPSHMLGLPSVYSLILDHAEEGQLASLRAVIVAGESCPRELVERHFEALPDAQLFNEYGPTEGTVWSTVHDCSHPSDRPQVPIGRPVPGVDVYVLDEAGSLVPIGEVGEIHIGGEQISPGYLGRPELTAEEFVEDPFRPGGRLYRTGDRGRFLPDGCLEFLGRADHQVKLRGYRIELEEIETVLTEHPTVRESVVLAREDHPGNARLVAYLTEVEGADPEPGDLRAHLAGSLPEYMVPTWFLRLDEMPRLPNGKVDRNALPAPEASRLASDREPVAPRTPLERLMAGIWAEVLGIDGVGIEDDFFELGGHSLLATQLFARLRDALRITAPLRLLFDNRTIGALARELTRDPAEHRRLERTAELTLQVLGLAEE